MVDRSFILLTTSRRPFGKTRAFCKDLSNVFPNIMRINRGKLSLDGVAEKAVECDAEKVIIISRWKGGLGKIQLFKISVGGLDVVPPVIYVKSVKLRRDMGGNMAKRSKISSIAIAASPPEKGLSETNRFEKALSQFLNISILPLKQVYKSKFDAAVQISDDPSNCPIVTAKLLPELVEVGPQISLSHLVWELPR